MLNEGTTFGTKLMTDEELASLKAKQTAAAAAQLMNANPAEEEPMAPPEGFVEQSFEAPITEKEMNDMINESDTTESSSMMTLEDPIENTSREAPIEPVEEIPDSAETIKKDQTIIVRRDHSDTDTEHSAADTPIPSTTYINSVAIKTKRRVIKEPELIVEETPQPVPTDDLYEAAPVRQPEPIEAPMKEEKKILRSLSELRRPDNNINDTILGYTDEGIEIRSRTSYNPSLIRIHRNFWSSDKKSPIPYITIPARAKIKRNGDTIPFIWDEGGCDKGKGFAVAVAKQDGTIMAPIMVVVPETDYQFYDNTIFCNWHHAKMPLNIGDFVLTASKNPQGDQMVAIYQVDNILVEDAISPDQRSCKATPEANLAFWMTIKNGSLDVHAIRDTPFTNNLDHPALTAVLQQTQTENSTRPTWCSKFVSKYNYDFRTYLNDTKFEPLTEVYTDNNKLIEDLEACTSKLCFELGGHQQVRMYRVAKFFPKTHDITVFYYVVKYDTDKRTYDDNGRIKYAQITFVPNDSILLFGDESNRSYTFEELLNEIQSTSYNNQSIAEFRRVTP